MIDTRKRFHYSIRDPHFYRNYIITVLQYYVFTLLRYNITLLLIVCYCLIVIQQTTLDYMKIMAISGCCRYRSRPVPCDLKVDSDSDTDDEDEHEVSN